MKKIILIPAYEPNEKLIELVKNIDKCDFDIVVVDDGSGYGYQQVFHKVEEYASLISYPVNQGKGHALKEGYQWIKKKYRDNYIVITMDSDGQHTIRDVRRLGSYVEKHLDTLVIGMRLRGKNTPLRSKIGNAITRFIYKITTGLDVYDTQTGLRAFSYQLMDFFLGIDGERFEYEMNVLLWCAREHVPISEIPIETIYIENNKSTHFRTVRDSYLIYREIIKFSLSSIFSFLIDYLFFTIFIVCFKNITLSNVLARIISASFNYIINRNFVFHSKRPIYYSAISYFGLALFILFINTVFLNFFIQKLLMNQFVAKILIEVLLFVISWFVQRKFIFQYEKEK